MEISVRQLSSCCQFHQHYTYEFLYKRRFGSFFYIHVTRKKAAKTTFARKIRTNNVDEISTYLLQPKLYFQPTLFLWTLVAWLNSTLLLKIESWDIHIYMQTESVQLKWDAALFGKGKDRVALIKIISKLFKNLSYVLLTVLENLVKTGLIWLLHEYFFCRFAS